MYLCSTLQEFVLIAIALRFEIASRASLFFSPKRFILVNSFVAKLSTSTTSYNITPPYYLPYRKRATSLAQSLSPILITEPFR